MVSRETRRALVGHGAPLSSAPLVAMRHAPEYTTSGAPCIPLPAYQAARVLRMVLRMGLR